MNNPLVLLVIGIVIALAAIGVNVYPWNDEDMAQQSADSRPTKSQPTVKGTAAPSKKSAVSSENKTKQPGAEKQSPKKPTFDIVRVTPEGDAVIAGRAQPNSTVVIIDNGQFVGQLDADDRGEWVFVPDKPLEPGNRQLSLEQRSKEHEEPIASDDIVIVVVPKKQMDLAGKPAKATTQALALKFPRTGDGVSTILQKPYPQNTLNSLSVDTVDYDDSGRLHISGRGEPARVVQIYLDNRFIGHSYVDDAGGWRLKPDQPVTPGVYSLRADEVDKAGKVQNRIELPFARAEALDTRPPEPMIIVQPGNSLWRLARRIYGSGYRYTTIFAANQEQIKDPNMIFPGQVFAVPATN